MIDLIIALEAELAGSRLPPGFRVTFCGVGKINAALATAAVLARPDCARVVNFGTAGSLRPELAGQLLRVNRMLQRDMDGRPLAALGDTPFEEGPAAGVIDLGGDGVSLSTGDNFVTAPPDLASDIVDMEGYATAKACIRAGVPFTCWKSSPTWLTKTPPRTGARMLKRAHRPSSRWSDRVGLNPRLHARRNVVVKMASPISTAPLPR